MNIEEVLKEIEECIMIGANIDIRHGMDIRQVIESQQKTIEDMKCCGNCKEIALKHSGIVYCSYAHMDTQHNDCCTAWDLKQ
ncbi:MAG: hypothetical protein GY928_21585 [Colwellia sp.]|nr:hypothetical protein [Colwellia sp.]